MASSLACIRHRLEFLCEQHLRRLNVDQGQGNTTHNMSFDTTKN